MPADPQLVFVAMAVVIGGLLLFVALLFAGLGVVRLLKLPQELPEGPRFEPPPPPARSGGDRVEARRVAERQARLRQVYAQAHDAVRAGWSCRELRSACVLSAGDERMRQAGEILARTSATARTAAEAAEALLTDCDKRLRADHAALSDPDIAALGETLAGHAVTAQGALSEARRATEGLVGDGGRRRILLMLVALAVMVVWIVLMQLLRK